MKDNCYYNINNKPLNFQIAPFLLWNDHNKKYFEYMNKYNTIDNENNIELMKDAFFSFENMDIIQNKIIKKLYLDSNETIKINKIKDESLIQVMNHIWLNKCKMLPYKLKEQIIELNYHTIEYIVPLLRKEYTFYMNYLRDIKISKNKLIDRPIFVNKKKDLPSYIK